ncbi:DNA-binding protein [Actinomadura sp. 7K507]|nr:DNA-binding protein [Actinomadura sp. 7K507]
MKSQIQKVGLTVDDVAAIWRIPKGTIYRYAHESQWRRYTLNRRVYYHPDDVMATLDPPAPGS